MSEDEAKSLVMKWYADRGQSIDKPPVEKSEVKRHVSDWEEILKESPNSNIWQYKEIHTSNNTVDWESLTWVERWRVCRWVSDLHAAKEAFERLDIDHWYRANLELDKHRKRKEYVECFDILNMPNEIEDASWVWDAIESTRQ